MNRESIGSRSVFVFAAAMLACGSDPADPDGGIQPDIPIGALRVLFVGNSATYFNNLPCMLEDMGSAAGQPIETVDVSRGGVGLDYHWNIGPARDTLDEGRWNVVVLQGGSLETFVTWAVTWANAIRAAGARPALYMPGPRGHTSSSSPTSSSHITRPLKRHRPNSTQRARPGWKPGAPTPISPSSVRTAVTRA